MDVISRKAIDREAIISLIVNSGIYRHHTLRGQLQKLYSKTVHDSVSDSDSESDWNNLTTTHWEVLYCLIECHLLDRDVAITDIPISTDLSASTCRRALRRLEDLGLATTTCDEQDKRRFSTTLSPEYHQTISDFVADYSDEFAGLIQRHDKQERIVAQETLERTKEELVESEALLIQAQRLASLGHWVWDDTKNVYLAVSEETARIYGLSVKEFMSRANVAYFDDRYVHPDDKVQYQAAITEADKSLLGYDIQVRIIRADGEVRHIREISEPVVSEGGVLVRSIGTTQDISDSVTTENALRESEAQLVQAQRLAALGHWVWDDVNDCYLAVSEENARIHDLTVEEFMNDKNIAYFDDRFVHPEDKARYQKVVRNADENRVPYDSKHRIVRTDGSIRYVREISEPVLDRDRNIVRSIGTTQDITDSVEVENALKESEAQLIHAQKLSSLGHWVWDDVRARYISVSEENARIYGMSVADFMARKDVGYFDVDFVHPDDRERVQSIILKSDETGVGYDVRYRIIRADGEHRHIREVTEPVLDQDGNLVRSIGMTQDITKNVATENVQRENEAQLVQAQRLASLGHWIWDFNSQKFTSVSEQTARIYGLSVEDYLIRRGAGYLDDVFVHPDDQKRVNAAVNEADKNGTRCDVNFRIIRADGELRHIREVSEPVLDKDGNVLRSIGTTQDVTTSVEAEIALKESEAQLLLAQHLSSLGHWVWDCINNNYLSVSDMAAQIYGMSVSDYMNRADLKYIDDKFMHPDDKDRVCADIAKADKKGVGYDMTYRIVRTDGETRTVREICKMVLDDDGKLVRSIGTVQDITDRVAVEAATRESDQRFRRLLDEQSDMVSIFKPDGSRTFVNKSFCDFIGKSEKHLLAGSYGDEIVIKKGVPSLQWVIGNSMPQSERREQVIKMLRHDGELRSVRWSDSGLFDADGNLTEIMTIGRDITDQ
jgi:PAS domain S-box-containing protein